MTNAEATQRYMRRLRLILKKQVASPPAPLAADDILTAQIGVAAVLLQDLQGTEVAVLMLNAVARGLKERALDSPRGKA